MEKLHLISADTLFYQPLDHPRMLIDEHPYENFYIMNGNRVLIKRAKFEEYLDQATAV